MVFRVQIGANSSVLNYWLATGTENNNPADETLAVTCLRFSGSKECRRYFRSQVLDSWRHIEEVTFKQTNSTAVVGYTNHMSSSNRVEQYSRAWISDAVDLQSVKL